MTTTTITNQNRHHPSSTPSQYYYNTTTPSHYFPSTSPSLIKGCCCCLFLLFSLLALITLAIILIILLAIKPKKPHFDLQQVTVQYVGIDPTSPSGTTASLSLSFRLLFTAQNPNKVGIKYGTSKFTIMYRGIPLGKGVVPGFYQPQHSQTTVETIVSVDHVSLTQADASEIIKEASVYDKVEFRVIGDVSAKIRIISLDSPAVSVSVACAIVVSPRKQALAYKQCGFDGLSV